MTDDSIDISPSGYPRFSDQEMVARQAALEGLVREHDLACLVVYGERGSSATAWTTGWFATHMAAAVLVPGERIELLVQRFNHVSNASRMVWSGVDVAFAGADGRGRLIESVGRHGSRGARVGWIGPLSHAVAVAFESAGHHLVDLGTAYSRLRQCKTAEELAWMRVGVALTDRSLEALLTEARPGVAEWGLAAAVEHAYVGDGGTNHLHYFASTPMDAPDRYVPAQWPSGRCLRTGDVLLTELSASYWGYPGQLLRSIAIDEEPGPLHREMHDVAEATFEAVSSRIRAGVHVQDLVDAAAVIDDAGYGLGDDLLHGFGGGYLPPVLRTGAAEIDPVPDMRLEAGMTVVLQPNVITRDQDAGVQTGELLLVTADGYDLLHDAPRGFLVAG